jgi:glutathione S-transferase
VSAKLYALAPSHSSATARAMLELKGVDHRVVNIPPGIHPLVLWANGFRGYTVPALKLDGRRIQGTLVIARELERMVPDPPLFPADPEERRHVEEAEAWGEAELQDIPRRLARWVGQKQNVRRWMLADVVHVPLPGVVAVAMKPVAMLWKRISTATDEAVRADLAALPETLGRIDGLIVDGTIGGDQPNAADLQIFSSTRLLLAFEDLRAVVEPHPAAKLARRLFPQWPEPFPCALPEEWLPPRR